MNKIKWTVGDWVIYRKQKRSESPGPRAESLYPDPHGEKYSYIVEKYWVVEEVRPNGELQLVTRRGKRHVVPVDDIRLRRPGLLEKWALAIRFREVEQVLRNENE